jgi:DsbC/DsbD-like thiol-disulfide interchange protein
MSARRLLLAFAMILLGGWSVPPSIAAEESRVQARLVAGTSALEPGSTFWLGVHFEIEDGWHIYWRNPGGAGLATDVRFELPDDFVAGPLQWPLPIAFIQSEGIPGYGYEGSVVLAAEVTISPDAAISDLQEVRAEVSWLACKGVCVLGSADLESSLAEIDEDPTFQTWADRLPVASETGRPPFSLSVTGGLSEGSITHWLRWSGKPGAVEWFPNPSEALEVGDVQIQTRGGLTKIDAEIQSRKGATGSTAELPSLCIVTGENGDRQGWELTAKLTND